MTKQKDLELNYAGDKIEAQPLTFEERLEQLSVRLGITHPNITPQMLTEIDVDWREAEVGFVYSHVSLTLQWLKNEYAKYGRPNVLVDRQVQVALNNFRAYKEEYAFLFARQLALYGVELKNSAIVDYYLD